MRHFKTSAEADKAWKELVYKMKESDESQFREQRQFEDKVASIIGNKELKMATTKSPHRNSSKK